MQVTPRAQPALPLAAGRQGDRHRLNQGGCLRACRSA